MNQIAIQVRGEKAHQKASYDKNKLHKRLRRETGKAIEDFNMIEEGDKVMVCISGGKDSLTMLDVLMSLQRHAPINFELVAVNLDQKQPDFPEHILPEYFTSIGVPYKILEEDTYSLVKEMVPAGKTYCGWCSRFRRGILYKYARQEGFTKVALGHHRDDMLGTLFLNLFYGGKMKTMPAKLLSDDKQNIVIRPLAYCKEKDIARYAQLAKMPIIPCNLCGSQDNMQRQVIKEMLVNWEKQYPGRLDSIYRGMTDIAPSHMLDANLFDFKSLQRQVPTDPAEIVNVVNV
jgi:tRNA 2-thiocytidine biosynthesis protein TtcA